jgi:hypothetical protein
MNFLAFIRYMVKATLAPGPNNLLTMSNGLHKAFAGPCDGNFADLQRNRKPGRHSLRIDFILKVKYTRQNKQGDADG